MTGSDVNAILIRLATLEATMVARLDGLSADNTRGEGVHVDHEARIRLLETAASESRGVVKLMTAGGAVGALVMGGIALVLRSFGI